MLTPKMIYLAGYGRSGGTLVGRALGEVSGVTYVGETYFLWQDGIVENRLCECGQAFHQCPFWSQVLIDAYGGKEKAERAANEIIPLQRHVARESRLAQIAFPALRSADFAVRLSQYQAQVESLYRSILSVSGADVIVDSSRHVVNGMILSSLANITTVHLVRDVRGVVHSYHKSKFNPANGTYLPTISTGRVVAEWNAKNIALELFGPRRGKYLRVRYEDFVHQPDIILRGILDAAGVESSELPVRSRTVSLSKHHAIGGNPDKFSSGEILMKEDDAWLTQLPHWERCAASLEALPLLVHYDYGL